MHACQDAEIGKAFHKILEKRGIKFMFGTKVLGSEKTRDGVALTVGRPS